MRRWFEWLATLALAMTLVTFNAHGEAASGWLGVHIAQVNSEEIQTRGLPSQGAVVVKWPAPGSPAEAAGLRRRDVVLSIDGTLVHDTQSFVAIVSAKPPGATATLDIMRGAKRIGLAAVLGKRPPDADAGMPLIHDSLAFISNAVANAVPAAGLTFKSFGPGHAHTSFRSLPFQPRFVNERHRTVIEQFVASQIDEATAIHEIEAMLTSDGDQMNPAGEVRLRLNAAAIVLSDEHNRAKVHSITLNGRGEYAVWQSDANASWVSAEAADRVEKFIGPIRGRLDCDKAAPASSDDCAELIYIVSVATVRRDEDRTIAALKRALELHDRKASPELGLRLHLAVLDQLPGAWDTNRADYWKADNALPSTLESATALAIRDAAMSYLKYTRDIDAFEAQMHAEAVAARMLWLFEGQKTNARAMARNVVAQLAPIIETRIARGLSAFSLWNKIETELLGAYTSDETAEVYRLVAWSYDFKLNQDTPFALPNGEIFPELLFLEGPEQLHYNLSMDRVSWLRRIGRLEQVLELSFGDNPNWRCGSNPEAACALFRSAAIMDRFGNHPNSASGALSQAIDVLEEARPADQRLYCRVLIDLGRYQLQGGEIPAAESTISKAMALHGSGMKGDRCDNRAALWETALGIARVRLDQNAIETALTKLMTIQVNNWPENATASQVTAIDEELAQEFAQHLRLWDCDHCNKEFRSTAKDFIVRSIDQFRAMSDPSTDAPYALAVDALAHRKVFGELVCQAAQDFLQSKLYEPLRDDASSISLCDGGAWNGPQRALARTLFARAFTTLLATKEGGAALFDALSGLLQADDVEQRDEHFDRWMELAFSPETLTSELIDPRRLFERLRLALDAARSLDDPQLERFWLELSKELYDRYTLLFWKSSNADVLKAHSNVGLRARQLLPITLQIYTRLGELALAESDVSAAIAHAARAFSLAEARISREWNEEESSAIAAIRPAVGPLRRLAELLHALTANEGAATDQLDAELASKAFQAMQFAQLSDTSLSVVGTLRRKRDSRPDTAELIKREAAAKNAYWKFAGNMFVKPIAAASSDDGEGDKLAAEFRAADKAVKAQRAKDDPYLSIEPVSLEKVRSELRADEAILLSLSQPNSTRFALVTGRATRFWSAAMGRVELEAAVAELRNPFERPSGGQRFSLTASWQLYSALLQPLGSLKSEGIEKLFFVPDGPLHALPLHILVTKEPTALGRVANFRAANISWLVRDLGVAVLPSISSFVALRSGAPHIRATLAFAGIGDPVLAGHPDRAQIASARALRGGDGRVDPKLIRALPSLPETRFEIEEVSKMLGGESARELTRLWLGSAATRSTIRSADLSRFEIISFATHGVVAGEIDGANEPGLVLTPSASGEEEDNGFLSATDISLMKLNASLVILSACNTAAGDGRPQAEGLSGLARSFFSAGARSVLATSWSIPSNPTVALMIATMRQRVDNPKIDWTTALRKATLAMIDELGDETNADPYAWGAFTVIGDGEIR
jgi:CHAT domain-containing protein